jgi:hypothetical protein
MASQMLKTQQLSGKVKHQEIKQGNRPKSVKQMTLEQVYRVIEPPKVELRKSVEPISETSSGKSLKKVRSLANLAQDTNSVLPINLIMQLQRQTEETKRKVRPCSNKKADSLHRVEADKRA